MYIFVTLRYNNTMISTFQEIITELGYSYNTTYASSDIDINIYQTSQTKSINFLKEIANYADHLFYRKPGTDTFWLVDKLTGITPAIPLRGYSLTAEEVPTEQAPAGLYFIETQIQQFEDTDYNLKPQLTRTESTSDTETDAGPDVSVKALSQPVSESGGNLVYDFANYVIVLNRKVDIYKKDEITLKQERYHDVQLGQAITFDNNRASGSGVVIGIEHTSGAGKEGTIYNILGSFTQK